MLQRYSTLFLMAIIFVSVVGYFVGLHNGIPRLNDQNISGLPFDSVEGTLDSAQTVGAGNDSATNVVGAVAYDDIPAKLVGPTDKLRAASHPLPGHLLHANYNPFAEIKIDEVEKERSKLQRASRRAFNGAPPIVPHSIENSNDAACYLCHSSGMRMAERKASVMSHQFLANCVQCHAPPAPAPFQGINSLVESSFVGLPAPRAGERAYSGAPPTIPHSQWMRENCLACHGGPNGWAGMESTHPWRTNCTQCHAPSAVLDQATPTDQLRLLPPLEVAGR